MSLGDVEARVSFRGDMASRPRWAARTLSWGLDLADFEVVPVKLTGFELEHATMLWSVFIRCITPGPSRAPVADTLLQRICLQSAFSRSIDTEQAVCLHREIMQTVQSQLVTVAISFLRTFGLFSGASGILGLLSSGVGAMAGDRGCPSCLTVTSRSGRQRHNEAANCGVTNNALSHGSPAV